jgi:hypothetical protein
MNPEANTTVVNGLEPAAAQSTPATPAQKTPKAQRIAPDGTPHPARGVDFQYLTRVEHADQGEILDLKRNGLSWDDVFDYIHAAKKPVAAAVVAPKAAPAYTVPVASMTQAQMAAEIARLQAANAALAGAKGVGKITMKISEAGVNAQGQETKGGSWCLYGFGRFPWIISTTEAEWLFGTDAKGTGNHIAECQAFLNANRGLLRRK